MPGMKGFYRLALAAAASTLPLSYCALAAGNDDLVRPRVDLSLQGASVLLEQAVSKAAADHVHPCIAIADASGNLLAFKRMDGAAPGCVEAAMAKARSAAINDVDTQVFYDVARKQNPALGSIPGILPAVAGVVIRQQGAAIGSIGIAGGASDAQEQQFATDLARGFERGLPPNAL